MREHDLLLKPMVVPISGIFRYKSYLEFTLSEADTGVGKAASSVRLYWERQQKSFVTVFYRVGVNCCLL